MAKPPVRTRSGKIVANQEPATAERVPMAPKMAPSRHCTLRVPRWPSSPLMAARRTTTNDTVVASRGGTSKPNMSRGAVKIAPPAPSTPSSSPMNAPARISSATSICQATRPGLPDRSTRLLSGSLPRVHPP